MAKLRMHSGFLASLLLVLSCASGNSPETADERAAAVLLLAIPPQVFTCSRDACPAPDTAGQCVGECPVQSDCQK